KVRVARARLESQGAGSIRDAEKALEKLRHVVVREAEVSMPPLPLDRDELGVDEPRKVSAHGLLGDVGDATQLGGGPRLPAQERGEDLRARAVADERGDAGDVGAVLHAAMLVQIVPGQYGLHRTIVAVRGGRIAS